jgi:plasmid stabilization system protein ParE
MRLIVLPLARREFDDAFEWSKSTFGRAAAARLQRRFEQAGRMLMRQPEIGAPTSRQARKLPLGKFPYTLVYRVQGEVITVIAVAHQSRMPGYWRGR